MHTSLLSCVLLLALTVSARPARAEFPSRALYLGVYGGADMTLRDWDLRAADRPMTLTPGSTGLVGVRVGFQILSFLALEGELAYLPLTASGGARNHALSYDLNAVFHVFMHRDWSPK